VANAGDSLAVEQWLLICGSKKSKARATKSGKRSSGETIRDGGDWRERYLSKKWKGHILS
jgi:hypothetical protein